MLNFRARFLVDVATGATLEAHQELEDVAEVSALFPNLGERTVKELFGWGEGHFEDIRQGAIGALFHMIQDWFAEGHVQRNRRTGSSSSTPTRAGPEEACRARRVRRPGTSRSAAPEEDGGALSAIDAFASVIEMIAEARAPTRSSATSTRRSGRWRRLKPRGRAPDSGSPRRRRSRSAAQTTSPWRIVFSVTTRGSMNCSR